MGLCGRNESVVQESRAQVSTGDPQDCSICRPAWGRQNRKESALKSGHEDRFDPQQYQAADGSRTAIRESG